MATLIICLFIATLMPILAKGPLAFAMRQEGRYDNRHPREQQKRLTGFGARAKAAHENCFEALMMFSPGVLALLAIGQVGALAENLALAFVIARVGYLFSYWFDQHILRSSFWFVGFGASIWLLWLAIPAF